MSTSRYSCDHTTPTANSPHPPNCILHPDTTQLMLKKAVDSVNPNGNLFGVGYGLGWFVNKDGDEVVCGERRPFCFGHTGGAIGATGVLMVVPTPTTSHSYQCDGCERWGCDPREGCGCGGEVCGVVVCVIFNLQEVEGVFTLGTDIAKEFLGVHTVV